MRRATEQLIRCGFPYQSAGHTVSKTSSCLSGLRHLNKFANEQEHGCNQRVYNIVSSPRKSSKCISFLKQICWNFLEPCHHQCHSQHFTGGRRGGEGLNRGGSRSDSETTFIPVRL